MESLSEIPFDYTGAKGTDIFWGTDIAKEAWGDKAKIPSHLSMGYFFRRFGPPFMGSDSHKSLCDYYLTTEDPEVVLWVTLSGSDWPLSVGGIWSKRLAEECRTEINEWLDKQWDWWVANHHPELKDMEETPENVEKASELFTEEFCGENAKGMHFECTKAIGRIPRPDHRKWREDTGAMHKVNLAIFNALKELERPVYIRDIAINVFGKCGDSEESVRKSVYAGCGIPKATMDALLETE